MRIGVDMLGLQSPDSRLRGVGRYGRNLLEALLALDAESEYIFYTYEGLPTDQFPEAQNVQHMPLRVNPEAGEKTLADALEGLVVANPDALDALLLINPFELAHGYGPPAKPLTGLTLMAVVHDLIPFLFQEQYLADPVYGRRFYRRLERLRNYDLLLTNSEATRADCLKLLGLPEGRVVTIGAAANDSFFRPDRSLPFPSDTVETLLELGVYRPFVFCLTGMDDRKNVWGLIDAFRLLPAEQRMNHQLVIACNMTDAYAERIRGYAEERGVLSSLVLPGAVPDAALRVLYQRCSAFVFPSLYEGFGLPILEAMHCGAPVIAGNNSSQVEVVGKAGILANAADAGDIAANLNQILCDAGLAARLRKTAVAQASQFSWRTTAERALEAATVVTTRPASRRLRADRAHAAKPRIAVFSPWPPKGSGISDYAAFLVNELKQSYTVDLYHQPGYVPEMGLSSGDFACYDYRLFERNDRVLGYRAVLHQMGNSFYHGFVYDAIWKHGGIVTLHDFCLSGFHFWRAHRGGDPFENLKREITYAYPDHYEEYLPQLRGWTEEPGGFQEALARRGLHLNRGVFEHADAVVVHSSWCVEQARGIRPEYADKTVVIPHGSWARLYSPAKKAEIRARYGLPPHALIIGSFGILTQGKMNVEAILAFQSIAAEHRHALFIFVGQDWENGLARRKVEELGLSDRILFLGRQPAEAFDELLGAVDIGVSLRRPPTYGETSGALLHMLRNGIPTVVNDVGTFSGYPDTVVRKVRMDTDGIAGLAEALRSLARDRARRESLGLAAYRYVARNHAWPRAAEMYADLFERLHAERVRSRKEQRSISLTTAR